VSRKVLISIVIALFMGYFFIKRKRMRGQNNPLNIEYNSNNDWKGAIRPHNGSRFDNFSDVKYGLRAGRLIIRNYSKRGLDTVAKIIKTWAPPSENDTNSYITFVLNAVHVEPSAVIDVLNDNIMFPLMKAMCKMESNYNLTRTKYYEII